MGKIKHFIAHLLGWNYGLPHAYHEDDKLMMSFKCSGCGRLSSIHPCDKVIDKIIDAEIKKRNQLIHD